MPTIQDRWLPGVEGASWTAVIAWVVLWLFEVHPSATEEADVLMPPHTHTGGWRL